MDQPVATALYYGGENNLGGNDEALSVIDGVVISAGSDRRTGIGGETVYGTGSDNMPADYGSSINDINPDDIESVQILKGPGASALYGQRVPTGPLSSPPNRAVPGAKVLA